MLPFRPWSVCLSVTFVHCAQTAGDIDISFAYSTAPRLSQIVNLGYIGQTKTQSPNLPKVAKWPTSCWFERRSLGDIRRQIAAEWLEQLWETTIALSNSTITEPLRPPFPQNEVQMQPKGPTSRLVLPPGEYDRWGPPHLAMSHP